MLQGDSGGPLACNGYLIGLVSYGARQCGLSPGVYTAISGYTSGGEVPFCPCGTVKTRIKNNILYLQSLFISLCWYYICFVIWSDYVASGCKVLLFYEVKGIWVN